MGLLKTGLKAAVAVRTADVIHERVLARQQQHAAAHGHVAPAATTAAQAAVAPASPNMGDRLEQLKQLGELRSAGVLTDAEFEVQKAQILST